MFCSDCNTKVEDSYKFCPNCGAKLDSLPPPEEPNTPIVKKKPMPFWFKLVALLAVLALIGVTAGILFTESWVDVVDIT